MNKLLNALAIALALLFCGVCQSQNYVDILTNNTWTYHDADWYSVSEENGSYVMQQYSVGDTGGTMEIIPTDSNKFLIKNGILEGTTFEIKKFSEIYYLLFTDNGQFYDFMANRDLSVMQINSGSYKSSDGKTYYIDAMNKSSKGFETKIYDISEYMDDDEWEFTCDIVFGSQIFRTEPVKDFFKGNSNGKKIKSLGKLTKYFSTDMERYPFTSTQIVTDELLEKTSKADLKIMRNEIFARHGYIFTTEAMKKHFEAQTWYKPTSNNVDELLNEVEKINIDRIKKAEAR